MPISSTDPTNDRAAIIGSVLGCLIVFLALLAASRIAPASPEDMQASLRDKPAKIHVMRGNAL